MKNTKTNFLNSLTVEQKAAANLFIKNFGGWERAKKGFDLENNTGEQNYISTACIYRIKNIEDFEDTILEFLLPYHRRFDNIYDLFIYLSSEAKEKNVNFHIHILKISLITLGGIYYHFALKCTK